MKNVVAFVAGILFSLGLCISQMTDPHKVRGFLDVTGKWDPSLAYVMAGAVIVSAVGVFRARRNEKPAFAESFSLPTETAIDARLILGAALFGIGWGISGWCPGPAIVSLASPTIALGVFLAAMTVSTVLVRRFVSKNGQAKREASAISRS